MAMKDKIVEEVLLKYQQRSETGIKKYGTTLEQNNKDNFLLHLQEELMDATLYIQKLLSKDAEITSFDNYFEHNLDESNQIEYPELEGTMNLCEDIIENKKSANWAMENILLNLSVKLNGRVGDYKTAIDEAYILSKQLNIGCTLNYANQYTFKILPSMTQEDIEVSKNTYIIIGL
jgi:hypothetical protein